MLGGAEVGDQVIAMAVGLGDRVRIQIKAHGAERVVDVEGFVLEAGVSQGLGGEPHVAQDAHLVMLGNEPGIEVLDEVDELLLAVLAVELLGAEFGHAATRSHADLAA